MYILLNGAFGIGKTTVAKQLQARLPGAVLFDPEWIGFALRRLPGRRIADYQQLASWRRLSILGARSFALAARTVIVPMAISELAIRDEIRTGLARSGRPVLHFCLVAPVAVVRDRLGARGELATDPRFAWVHRRAAECCSAHAAREFGTHIPALETPERIAAEIARRIATPARASG